MKLFGALLAFAIALPFGLRSLPIVLNHSASVPLGFYRKTATGKYAGFCLDRSQLATAKASGLELPPGDCPGGVLPILKPLYRASKELAITFSGRGFTVAGKEIPYTAPKSRSKTGKPLTHCPFGTYTGGLWAISSYTMDSYDSRYLGPLDARQIEFYAEPLWVW